MVNNIKNNKINEIFAKKRFKYIKTTKKGRNDKTKKKRTPKQKELLNLFNDLLDTILIDKTLKSESQEDENENEKEKEKKKENENDKTLMPSKDEHEKQNKLLNNDNYVNAKNKKNSTKKATNKKKMRMKTFY